MQPGGDLPRIKLDLTLDEILVLDPTIRNVHHPYSDCPDDGIQSKCYCFEEVFAEKSGRWQNGNVRGIYMMSSICIVMMN